MASTRHGPGYAPPIGNSTNWLATANWPTRPLPSVVKPRPAAIEPKHWWRWAMSIAKPAAWPSRAILLTRALEAEANNANAHAGLAQSLRMDGELDAAEYHLQQAISLDPAYWQHHFILARVVYEQGRVDVTISELQQAIRLAPDNPLPYVSLGAIYYYEGDYLRAAEINRQSLERNPTTRAYSNAGSYYFYAGEYAQAEAMYRRALELYSPGDFRWHGFLAEALEMQADD